MKKKILITTGVITIIILTMLQGKVNAATLQSNPNTHYKTTETNPNVWLKSIRAMEASGGAMGLSETVNNDQTFKEKSNNIDVHMMKSTEYGAIAILSVSGYGNSKTIPNSIIKTTTGNETGIYFNSEGINDINHYEIIDGGLSNNIFSGINTKYYDSYSSSRVVKVGDALDLQWQGATDATNYWIESSYSYFIRNCRGYFGFSRISNRFIDQSYSRGIAVCGIGF